jgi:hypothetical protein
MNFEGEEYCTPEQGNGLSSKCPEIQPAHPSEEDPFVPAISVMRNGLFALYIFA